MSGFVSRLWPPKRAAGFIAAAAFVGIGVAVSSPMTRAATNADAIPDFAPAAGELWVPDRPAGDDFLPPETGPGPVTSDRAHAYSPLAQSQGQLMFHVADLDNPILKPWAAEQMRKANDDVLAGKFPYTARDRCWPGGVPGIDVYERDRPIYFLQTPAEVLIVTEYDQQVRHIRMNVPHSAHPKPSWYGESIGHYEGQSLVVDTIGMNDKTFVDNYRTPHTTQLHVVERFTLMDGGKNLQASIAVDDPGAFNMPWSAIQRWKRRDGRPLVEVVCAENSASYFNYEVKPIPTAAKPDF
ncbi:MAG TPA: hypothetical protein VHT51_10270 [Micropepsaceae bacterium]|jgi:hypothetical protein|nr:hypothetical protein [Micropepsaceae bacterium]